MPGRKTKRREARPARGAATEAAEAAPPGMPYTVYFPDGDGFRGADLEHSAPLPRVGDRVDYIDERGDTLRFVVREVVHTLQSSVTGRPSVEEGPASPNALARTDDSPAEPPGAGGSLRAGLPEVFLSPMEPQPPAETKGDRPRKRTARS